MSRIWWKSFHLCFPSNLIKCSPSQCLPPPPSSTVDHHQDDPNRPSHLTNFNCLYDHDHHRSRDHHDADSRHLEKRITTAPSTSSSTTRTATAASATTATATSSSSDDFDNYDIALDNDSPPPDFAAAFASRRFFFSSPGRSNAIIESPESRSRELSDIYSNATTITTTTTTTNNNINAATESQDNYNPATTAITTTTTTVPQLLGGGAAVKHFVNSSDPYRDFRRSMEEMIEAKDHESSADEYFEFLHELLFSYLSLNPRDAHEFIVKAFADVLVSLLSDGRRKF